MKQSSSESAAADASTLRVPPRRHSRARLSTFRAIETACRAVGGRAWYRRTQLAHGRFELREERVRVVGLPRALDGFTLAQLSDLHAGPFLARGDLRDVVDAVVARDVDLVALTGDFITHQSDDARLLCDDLARLRARHGVYAVFGNHDYRGRREGSIADELGAVGVRFLRNASARIAHGDAHLAVVGLEDLEEARVIDLARARRDVSADDFEICLCHNPSALPLLARERCCVVLAGHTHGTQIDWPWLRRLGPKHPGLRVRYGPTTMFVSRGLGVVGVPLRVGARAEVVIVRLERA